jgi:hypothetical protein
MNKNTKRPLRGAFLLIAFAPPVPEQIGMLSQSS